MRNNGTISNIFNRYAPITKKPIKTDPISILLDISELSDSFVNEMNSSKVTINSFMCDVENNLFIINTDQGDLEINVEFISRNNKYLLTQKKGITIKFDFFILELIFLKLLKLEPVMILFVI